LFRHPARSSLRGSLYNASINAISLSRFYSTNNRDYNLRALNLPVTNSAYSNLWLHLDRLEALCANWWAQIPRGLEDFFPKGAKNPTPTTSTKQTNNDSSTDSKEESTKSQRKSTKEKKNDGKRQSSGGGSPGVDDTSWPGWLAAIAIVVAVRSYLDESADLGQEITWVDFRNRLLLSGQVDQLQVVNKKVARVILKPNATTTDLSSGMDNNNAVGTTDVIINSAASARQSGKEPPHYYFNIGSLEGLEDKLQKAQQHLHPEQWVEVQYITHTNVALEALKVVPFLAFVAALYYGTKASGVTGGGSIFSVGKSNAKKIRSQDVNVSFKDVAGCEQAKLEIMEFVDFLKDASRFTKLGAKIPKGALLCGPPGTGKTLLAKAVAGEAGVPFYSISGSDFIEMFVGVGPSRVRDLFKEARQSAPCIIFIDEIDAVGRQRGRGGFSGGNDERENTLNQLLVEMDGFSPTSGVVVLAGTNRVDILDQALTRPGRFDRQIQVDRPDIQGRKEIFKVHLQGIKLEGQMEDYAGRLAGLTPGFAGADIANICNEAAIVAARRQGKSVTMEDFEKATDRIIGGLESNKIMSFEERQIVAHHEAGHAIAGWFLEHADPLLKVTIIPRTSGALGFAQYLPKEVYLRSKDQIMDVVCMALAGRAAEQVFFGRVTTGASDDLRRVTQIVYSMIKDFGMNSRVGQLSFPKDDSGMPTEKRYSDSFAEAMDEEARSIVDAAYQRTVDLITKHKTEVAKVAQLLLDKETITHDDIVDLVGERPFEGDSVYKEYVSSRHSNKKEDEAKKETAKEERPSEPIIDGDLTPGLA
jgi:AFG3 family protein